MVEGANGQAGRRGEKVRSDLFVRFETRAEGVEIEIDSRVAAYYGRALQEQARRELGRLGVKSGRLVIEDQGALPFTISARIEAAVRAAGVQAPRFALAPPPPPSPRDRLRRSRLYLPGDEPKFMAGAGLYGADAVILDLEDAVHPAQKEAARCLSAAALRELDFGGAERMVRINPLPLGQADLAAVIPAQPDLVLLPKAEDPEQVRAVDGRIRELQRGLGGERPVWLMPILESARGVEQAFAIASSSERVVALTIGLEDYTADLGVARSAEGRETLWARQRLVNAARAAGCQAIDSVYADVGDLDGLGGWARRARALGFCGMGCLHPRQIPVIHQAFAPTAGELRQARRIVAAFREAEKQGLAVVALGSKMIDPPIVQRARDLVARAREMGLPEDESDE